MEVNTNDVLIRIQERSWHTVDFVGPEPNLVTLFLTMKRVGLKISSSANEIRELYFSDSLSSL